MMGNNLVLAVIVSKFVNLGCGLSSRHCRNGERSGCAVRFQWVCFRAVLPGHLVLIRKNETCNTKNEGSVGDN